MISSVSAHGLKPHLLNGSNAATNAAAAKYLASLQLNGTSDLAASRAAGQFVQQLQQHHYQQQQQHHQQQQQQQAATQGSQKAYKGVHRYAVSQESRPFGEHTDASVPFVTPHSYHTAQPSYPANTAHTQLRPAAADSRAHMHLQFGNNTISPMKEPAVNQRRFSTGAHQWEDADPSLVAALYSRFFDGNAVSKPDRRLSTGHVVNNGGMNDNQRYYRVSGNRHLPVQHEQRRPYLPHPSELGPGWS